MEGNDAKRKYFDRLLDLPLISDEMLSKSERKWRGRGGEEEKQKRKKKRELLWPWVMKNEEKRGMGLLEPTGKGKEGERECLKACRAHYYF